MASKSKAPQKRVSPVQLLTLLRDNPPRGCVMFDNRMMSWGVAIHEALETAIKQAPKPRKPRTLSELPTIPV